MSDVLLLTVLLAASRATAPAAAPPPSPDGATLTVQRAVELALARAPEIAAARAAADEAAGAVRETESPRKPHFSVNSTPGYSTGLPLSVAGEVPSAAGARLSMTLYDPYSASDTLEARAGAAAAQGVVDQARADVARRTAAACARLSSDEARAASARRRVEAREAIARQEGALAREGRRTELDVERAGLEEARARQKLYAAESDRDLDRHELALLIGRPAGAALTISGDPAEAVPAPDADGTADRAIARDPKWKALGRQADALSRSAKLLAQTFKPSVNAEARYAYVPRGFGYDKYYLSFQENVASVGVSVVLPLLTGGREAAQQARSRARLEQVLAERSEREADLARASRQAEARLAQTSLETGIARRAAALGEEALSQARAVAREGRGEADGVERAQLALADAEDDLARARREEVEARLELLGLRGELLSTLGAQARDASGVPESSSRP
jgi:outer membrane protein TolC